MTTRRSGHTVAIWRPQPSTDPLTFLLAALADREDLAWQDLALCAETDPDSFYVEKGGDTRPAKRVCMRCEVRVQCLEYALERDERYGIWGAKSERERRIIKRQREQEAA